MVVARPRRGGSRTVSRNARPSTTPGVPMIRKTICQSCSGMPNTPNTLPPSQPSSMPTMMLVNPAPIATPPL